MLVIAILFRAALVVVPLVVATFATQRLLASRSRNRLIYAAVAAVTVVLALGNLPFALDSGPPRAMFIVMTALTVPAWALVRFICWRPGGQEYRDQAPLTRQHVPAEEPRGRALPPLLLTAPLPPKLPDPPREADRNAERLVFRHGGAARRQADGTAPLSFIPSATRRS